MKRDILTKLIMVCLFMSSFAMSALWLAGYVEEDTLVNSKWFHSNTETALDSELSSPYTLQETKHLPQQKSYEEWMEQLLNKSYDSLYEKNRAEEWHEIEAETEDWYKREQDEMLDLSLEATKLGDDEYLEQIEEERFDAQLGASKEASVQITSTDNTSTRNQTFDLAYDLELVESDLDLTLYETRTVVATGYTAGYESTGKHPDHPQYGVTFSGVQVRRDLYSTIAADPNVFPLGTVLYIPNYGYGIVADTGGAIKGNKIDLYYETVEDVFNLWGKRTLDVYVISYGEGYVTEAMLDHYNHQDVVQVYLPKR